MLRSRWCSESITMAGLPVATIIRIRARITMATIITVTVTVTATPVVMQARDQDLDWPQVVAATACACCRHVASPLQCHRVCPLQCPQRTCSRRTYCVRLLRRRVDVLPLSRCCRDRGPVPSLEGLEMAVLVDQ